MSAPDAPFMATATMPPMASAYAPPTMSAYAPTLEDSAFRSVMSGWERQRHWLRGVTTQEPGRAAVNYEFL